MPSLLRRTLSSLLRPTPSLLAQGRAGDPDRWYGHLMECDLSAFRWTGERPAHLKPVHRPPEEVRDILTWFPPLTFLSTYECLLFDADRMNPGLNRKEFGNETRLRLEKQANVVARSQALLREGKYAARGPAVEDSMLARIVDEEHVQAEMKYVKCIRANEVAEDNRLDILPGGSPSSLREKTRWNLNTELHPYDRNEISERLMAWLPEKYHIVYYDDFQTVAANDAEARKEMLEVVDQVERDHAEEAKASNWTPELEKECAQLRDDVDPSRAISSEEIRKCKSLDTLEAWSRVVHEYNGDERIFDIYARAAQLTKNVDHAKLVEEMRSCYKKKVVE